MHERPVIAVHFLVTLAELLHPGGVRAVAAHPAPKIPRQLIAAIVRPKRRNPGFGCVLIAQKISRPRHRD